jgi:hypothetical protein
MVERFLTMQDMIDLYTAVYIARQKVSMHPDSRTVAMEVGIRLGVCNNLPAECIGPENGWRLSVLPIPRR